MEDLGVLQELAYAFPFYAGPFADVAPFAGEGFLVGWEHVVVEC